MTCGMKRWLTRGAGGGGRHDLWGGIRERGTGRASSSEESGRGGAMRDKKT